MIAAWYDRQGPAADVLTVGSMPAPDPGPGDVRIRVLASGVNPGDVKKRSDAFGIGMPFPRVIPHSDGAGVVDLVGHGVSEEWIGQPVWCFGAQSYRPFGTAAEYVVVPEGNIAPLPEGVEFVQGACLGIPGITGHRAVHVAGNPNGKTILVQGGAGAVGSAAVALARFAGANVIATVRSERQESVAIAAGAHRVVRTDGLSGRDVEHAVLDIAPEGVDHIVEVAFSDNVVIDERLLRLGGSIAAYATGRGDPQIPFWPLVFKNIDIHFLGSDDFAGEVKSKAASDISAALSGGWSGYHVSKRFRLSEIADAHQAVEARGVQGRVVVDVT